MPDSYAFWDSYGRYAMMLYCVEEFGDVVWKNTQLVPHPVDAVEPCEAAATNLRHMFAAFVANCPEKFGVPTSQLPFAGIHPPGPLPSPPFFIAV